MAPFLKILDPPLDGVYGDATSTRNRCSIKFVQNIIVCLMIASEPPAAPGKFALTFLFTKVFTQFIS